MKRITLLTLFVALMSFATQAQENTYNMVIEMTDGTKITVSPDDISTLTFNNGELTVTGLELGELIETLATKEDLEHLRQEMYAFVDNFRYEDSQFFEPLADFFDKSYWDREDIGEALVEFLEAFSALAKENQNHIYFLEERHDADITELKELIKSLIKRIEALESGSSDKHATVDLGLPSGTLWATCNVGANSPEEYGLYFAWGETEGYTGDTSDGRSFDWASYKWCNGNGDTLTKYCTNSNYGYNGFTDGLTELLPEDDAATANWGSEWRMPSKEQFEELINSSYTTTEWTTLNGVNGQNITSKSNGNSIFLPAAGYRYDASLDNTHSYGLYWSRSLSAYGTSNAHYLYFVSGGIYTTVYYRSIGQSVRPVRAQN